MTEHHSLGVSGRARRGHEYRQIARVGIVDVGLGFAVRQVVKNRYLHMLKGRKLSIDVARGQPQRAVQ
jgi:hypothetical protein